MNHELNDKQLEKLLESIGKDGQPSAKFQKALLKSIKAKYKETYGRSFVDRFLKFKLQFSSVLTLLALTTTTIYAYNSDSIVSGDVLYPLKRSVERVEGLLAIDEEEKSSYYSKMAERRTRELEHIQRESESYLNTINESERMIKLAKHELNRLERGPVKIEKIIDRKAIGNQMIQRAEIKREIQPMPKQIIPITDTNIEAISEGSVIEIENADVMELEADATIIEESINLPATTNNSEINVEEEIEIETDKDTTVLRSRIQKVESDIERFKEEQNVFLKENIQVLPSETPKNSTNVDLKIDIKSNININK